MSEKKNASHVRWKESDRERVSTRHDMHGLPVRRTVMYLVANQYCTTAIHAWMIIAKHHSVVLVISKRNPPPTHQNRVWSMPVLHVITCFAKGDTSSCCNRSTTSQQSTTLICGDEFAVTSSIYEFITISDTSTTYF